MTNDIIKSAQVLTTSEKKTGRKYWSKQFLQKDYIVYVAFHLFSTVELTSLGMLSVTIRNNRYAVVVVWCLTTPSTLTDTGTGHGRFFILFFFLKGMLHIMRISELFLFSYKRDKYTEK